MSLLPTQSPAHPHQAPPRVAKIGICQEYAHWPSKTRDGEERERIKRGVMDILRVYKNIKIRGGGNQNKTKNEYLIIKSITQFLQLLLETFLFP